MFWRVRPERWTSADPSPAPFVARGRVDGDRLVGLLVLVGARRHDRVDEHLDVAPEPGLVPLEPDRLLQGQQLVEPAALVVGGHVVGEAGRGVPGRSEYAAAKTWS